MNSRIQNQLTMAGTCLTVSNKPEFKPVWTGQAPADFETDIAKIATDYAAVGVKAAQAETAAGGGGDVKAAAETVLEDAAFLLTRALANHFKKTGDLDRYAKVNFTKSAIKKLRAQQLVAQTTAIRDVGTGAVAETDAANRGVTPANVAALTAAIDAYSFVMNKPRGDVVSLSTLLKEVETDTAALLDDLSDVDDLVPQFGGTDAGAMFVAAWKQARIIVDSGGHGGGTPPPPAPPATSAKPV